MSNRRYTSPQPPARSILKPSRSSHTTSAHPTSRSSSALPVVEVRDAPVPTQASQRALQNLPNLPLHGPIPAMIISFPATQSREQLEQLIHQVADQLAASRIEEERKQKDNSRVKISRPQAGHPTLAPDKFPEFRQILMGPWVSGPSYGPILGSNVAMKLPSSLWIHPYLSAPSPGSEGHLEWDVTQPLSSARFVEQSGVRSYNEFCGEPATAPRLIQFEIISRVMPWAWTISRANKLTGVTIGDCLSSLSFALSVPMRDIDLDALNEEHRKVLLRTYQDRCPERSDRPRLYDMLAGSTSFAGLMYDRAYEEERDSSDKHWEIHILVMYLPRNI